MPSIHFLDVTNRDGVQTARTGLSKFGKVKVNFYLGCKPERGHGWQGVRPGVAAHLTRVIVA